MRGRIGDVARRRIVGLSRVYLPSGDRVYAWRWTLGPTYGFV